MKKAKDSKGLHQLYKINRVKNVDWKSYRTRFVLKDILLSLKFRFPSFELRVFNIKDIYKKYLFMTTINAKNLQTKATKEINFVNGLFIYYYFISCYLSSFIICYLFLLIY